MIQSRTDLALELQEELEQQEQMEGIRIERRVDKSCGISETRIYVETEEASKRIGKPIGQYITLESQKFLEEDSSYYEEMSEALYGVLKSFVTEDKKVLVAGLGNSQVTPDALGPLVVENLFVTRHLKNHDIIKEGMELSAIVPGVMAQTGMETGEILKGIIEETKPDLLIAIDALSARNSNRLNKTIQVSNTGIAPGSGVGNHRQAITEEAMGIPVIAIGVPTVISVPAIVGDAMDAIFQIVEECKGSSFSNLLTEEEKLQLAREIMEPDLATMFVTPKNIDEAVRRISFTISEAINRYIPIVKGI